jgi:transposase
MKFTLKDFRNSYGTDDKCLEALLELRYGKRSKCEQCGKKTNWSRVSGRACYQCQWCRYQIYPMKSTIFEGSHMSLADWFYVLYLMTVTRHGVSAKEIQRQLGCSYKTAWRNCDLLRQLLGMSKVPRGKMRGHVEADEHYQGGKRPGVRGRGARGKTKIFGLAQRGGEIRTFVVDNVQRNTLMPLIEQNVEKGSRITTDEFLSYNAVGEKYDHGVVRHGRKEFVNGDDHTQNVENFWGSFKRSVKSTHIHISKKHASKYLGEFAFRYSNRNTPELMFSLALARIAKPA